MNDIPYEKIMEYLHQMGMVVTDNIKSGVEIAYPIVLRQVYVDVVYNLMWFLIGVVFIFLSKKLWDVVSEWVKEDDEATVLFLFSVIGYIIGAIAIFVNLFYIMAYIINPHWYAVQKIFEMIGGN